MLGHISKPANMGMPAYLNREYERRRDRNPRYSLRAFARDLGCDHATVSQWMRRVRPMSEDASRQVCDALRLTGPERQLACEIDEADIAVWRAIKQGDAQNTQAVVDATGLTPDHINLSLFKLLRLAVLRLEGTRWRLIEKEIR
jgi:transcriptional regulator with XRE-family HTH domain